MVKNAGVDVKISYKKDVFISIYGFVNSKVYFLKENFSVDTFRSIFKHYEPFSFRKASSMQMVFAFLVSKSPNILQIRPSFMYSNFPPPKELGFSPTLF